jgi:hypothetical protein
MCAYRKRRLVDLEDTIPHQEIYWNRFPHEMHHFATTNEIQIRMI